MKTKISILFLLLLMCSITLFAQEKSKKQIKEEKKLEKQKQVQTMMNERVFIFTARTALPQGYKTVNLNSNMYTVDFSPAKIVSYLPYYGRAYSGVSYGGDDGLKFEGTPEDFTVTTGKKNYSAKAEVKSEKEVYKLMLTVGFEGSATLTVSSNNRSSISFNGEISAPEKKPAP